MRSKKLLITLVTLALIQPTSSSAATPKKITTCANKKSGAIRLATKCAKTETKLTWNQSGPVGPRGATIHNGPTLPNTSEDQTPVGDYFLVTSTMTLFGPKTDKGWPEKGFSLQGPAGSGGSGPQGPKGDTGAKGDTGDPLENYGSFIDTTTYTLTTTPVPLNINTTLFAQNISILDNSKIKFTNIGKYNIQFSSQLFNNGNKACRITMWLKKNSAQVDNSSTDIYLGTSVDTERQVAAWNFFVSASANDFYQIYAVVNSGCNAQILSGDSTNKILDSPNIPAIPGTIVTVNQVG